MLRLFLATLILLALTSCGFHLRGEEPITPELQHLYLKTKEPYSQLTHNLKAYFKLAGIHLTDSPETATYVLNILSETQNDILINVSGTQQTRQYSLVLTVNFQMTRPDGTVVLPQQAVTETRVFTMQANQILGGSNEETTMYQQMRRDIIFDLMNRLTSQHVTNLLEEAKHRHETRASTT